MWSYSSQEILRHKDVEKATTSELPDEQPPAAVASPMIEQQLPLTITGNPNQRLGIHPILRAPIIGMSSFICGFALGAAHGGPIAAYRYRAENAHRLPTTQTGWFLYQKSKNYHTMLGGMKEGAKFGCVLLGWAGLFMAAEEGVDRARGRLFATGEEDVAPGHRDFLNTVVAAMGVAGFYSWRRGLDTFATARTSKIALKYSLVYGLVQDIAASFRGSQPAYINWLRRRLLGQDTLVQSP